MTLKASSMLQPAKSRRRPLAGRSPAADARRARTGFTLVELLVSLAILLILATITIRLVNGTLDNDRMKTGSRELQSYLAGARDRAIYAGQPRGVRFIPDPTDNYTVRRFVYVGASNNYTDGSSIIVDSMGNITLPMSGLKAWQNLWSRGQFVNGTPIQMTLQSGTKLGFFTVSPTTFSGTTPTAFAITTQSSQFPITSPGATYTLQLAPTILPNEQPRALPANIVIDLRTSVLPASWPAPPTAASNFDILFSPQGTVIGAPASDGRIHFVLADLADTTAQTLIPGLTSRYQLNAPWQASTQYVVGNVIVPMPSSFIAFRCTQVTVANGTSGTTPPTWPTQANATVTDKNIVWQSFVKKTNLIVSLATSTGRVTSHPVDVSTVLSQALPGTDAVTTDPEYDPGYDSFRFAEIGEVTQ